jgi:hypothetical protein
MYGPYTGRLYDIRYFTPDMEHFWPLKYVHEHGGACVNREQRRAVANDPLNLVAVHPSSNRKKSFRLAEYLPINGGYWPNYLERIESVYFKYTWLIVTTDAKRRFKTVRKKSHEIRNGFFIEKQKNWFMRFWAND